MIRVITLLAGAIAVSLWMMVPGVQPAAAARIPLYHAKLKGSVIAFKPAGFEPDFDLIDRAVLKTTLRTPAQAPMTLILDAYLENFQPDTTPLLPDILNGKQQARNLGGFLQGKAIIIDPAGHVLYSGDMLAEAFLNGANHMVVTATGQGTAAHSSVRLKSIFYLNHHFQVAGIAWGAVDLPAAARHALKQTGTGGRTLSSILKQFTVAPPPMRGTAAHGKPAKPFSLYGHSTNVRSKAGSRRAAGGGSTAGTPQPPASPAWMAPLGGALLIAAALLFGLWLRLRLSPH